MRRSASGELNTSLDLRFAKNTLAGRVAETATFEGGIPGPTFRIRPGNRFRIHYTNNLKYPESILPAAAAEKAQSMAAKMAMPGMHMEGPPTRIAYLRALDADNGRVLWQTRFPSEAVGGTVTFSINGRQYLAIAAGGGRSRRSASA
jgi:FtsP/CotA-like multicopper oxidase with cupredoxin domain